MDFSQKIKNKSNFWSSNPISGYIQRKWKQDLKKLSVPQMFIIHNSQGMEIILSISQWMVKEGGVGSGYNTICDNLGNIWGHYAKWNKSGREKQLLHDVT